MKFNRLQASISNNADQSPNLYMALCAVESLFADLEDNCGSELSQCPVGDERLPSKLVWLCRVINEIYRDNSDDLQRNRSRLDAAIQKMNETKEKLEDSATIANQLALVKAEHNTLTQQLQRNLSAAEECEALTHQCRQAKDKLEKLRAFDPDAMRAELAGLHAQITEKEQAKAEILEQLAQANMCINGLQSEVDRLNAKEQDMQKQFMVLREQQLQMLNEKTQLREEMGRMEADYAAAKEEWRQLIAQKDTLQQSIDQMQEKITLFREGSLTEKQAELEVIRKELSQLEADQDGFAQVCAGLKEKRNQLIMETAYMKAENESLQEKLTLNQQKREALESSRHQLMDQLSACLQELETLQAEADQLASEKLPEAQLLREQEALRKAQLQESIKQLEEDMAASRAEAEKLNNLLPQLEEEVKNSRVVYDALTASCAASSYELENLERQIAELRSNTDEQKLMIYRKQLEETQQELEGIQRECQQIQQNIAQQTQRLEQMQEERARLRQLQIRHEQGVAVTEKQLQELAFVANEQYLQEVTALDAKAKLLESVRSKLATSIANMHQILGNDPMGEHISLEGQMKQNLRDLRQKTDDLCSALLACAKNLKMEER